MWSRNEIIDKLDDAADIIVRKSRRYLPHVARLCLTATFIEDGFRLLTQWTDQIDFIQNIWGAFRFIAMLFILANITLQFVGGCFVLLRYRVRVGCAILMITVILQTIGYNIWTRTFVIRNLSLVGSLVLLIAEAKQESKSLLAGLPSSGLDAPKKFLQLSGRILVVLVFLTLIYWRGSLFYFIQSVANLVLIILVAVGFKTKLCALVLVLWLSATNCYYNSFWMVYHDELLWDFLKYDFFQTWSVIGGLLLIVAYGPGDVSLDDYKKKW